MSELQELYEKLTKGLQIHTRLDKRCADCPYCAKYGCLDLLVKDGKELIELQHAEIERLKDEGKENKQ